MIIANLALSTISYPTRACGIIVNYTMLYKYGKRKVRVRFEAYLSLFSLSTFWGVFNKTITPLALVGYEMIIELKKLRSVL